MLPALSACSQLDHCVCLCQGWQTFTQETGRDPDMVVFASALWDIARWASPAMCISEPAAWHAAMSGTPTQAFGLFVISCIGSHAAPQGQTARQASANLLRRLSLCCAGWSNICRMSSGTTMTCRRSSSEATCATSATLWQPSRYCGRVLRR